MKHLFLFSILYFSSFALIAQIDRVKSIPLPQDLSSHSNAVEIYTTPNPDFGEVVKNQGFYKVKWTHQTYIVAHEDLIVKELGAYLLYNGTWMLRQSYKKKEIKDMFNTSTLKLNKGDTLVFEDNIRFDSYSNTGWNFWYVKVVTKDRVEQSSLDYLETRGVSKFGEILHPCLVDSSIVTWTGKAGDSDYKLSGTISNFEGALLMEKDMLKGGIMTLDLSSMKGENEQLLQHLKSEDFFDVNQFPSTTFIITEVSMLNYDKYRIGGDMTILGVTNKEETEVYLESNEKHYYLSFKLVLDRTLYGMIYSSSKDPDADYSISDEIYINAKLIFQKDFPGSLPWNTFEKP